MGVVGRRGLIVAGGLPLLWLCWLGVRYRVGRIAREEPEHGLQRGTWR